MEMVIIKRINQCYRIKIDIEAEIVWKALSSFLTKYPLPLEMSSFITFELKRTVVFFFFRFVANAVFLPNRSDKMYLKEVLVMSLLTVSSQYFSVE